MCINKFSNHKHQSQDHFSHTHEYILDLDSATMITSKIDYVHTYEHSTTVNTGAYVANLSICQCVFFSLQIIIKMAAQKWMTNDTWDNRQWEGKKKPQQLAVSRVAKNILRTALLYVCVHVTIEIIMWTNCAVRAHFLIALNGPNMYCVGNLTRTAQNILKQTILTRIGFI